MYGKAIAPEYQGQLRGMSVNTAYEDVLAAALAREAEAVYEDSGLELAQARLTIAEAYRRLGMLDEADAAWRASYRAARSIREEGAMAWALWSGGTLARQRGQLTAAVQWLSAGRELAQRAGESLAYGYAVAGIAETLRIRGDHEEARGLHEQLLAEARKRGECRHLVWALEGLAQLDRNAGDLDSAWRRFKEAAGIAEEGGDERGLAWALRGLADVRSLRGEHDEALWLLSRAEQICRRMDLTSALAYNRKMRGNVLFRACWYGEAARTYRDAQNMFRSIKEPRGAALAELGLLKSLDKLGRPRPATEQELHALRDRLDSRELRHTKRMVEEAISEMAEVAA
ncbi:tetratricopeptide repeat protein [Saccharopolyspora phatthalungensis]|uniref:Tetratricopeptide (TPR) repeat protein n=1 Tax=Saccharopolyspora phatthalungensis TaxID=664693 RepID=A0A840Q9F9_9PSEU|nr:tetratricopeptide repeat protein [Saccharopolyspora phatthalungensis]MBB5155085.1 tetratricopeptide (TPR) repeat protein [Saccharopolyspora phatthalungensis]